MRREEIPIVIGVELQEQTDQSQAVDAVCWALVLARASAGKTSAARVPMMAMTTSNSIKVKPASPCFVLCPKVRCRRGRRTRLLFQTDRSVVLNPIPIQIGRRYGHGTRWPVKDHGSPMPFVDCGMPIAE